MSRQYRARRFMAVLITFIMAFSIYGLATTVFADTGDETLTIKNVEVLTGGAVQELYRASVHKGDVANGEDPNKYYTTMRGINLNDPRTFTFTFNVDAQTVGDDTNAFLETVGLQYGGHDLDEWRNDPESSGSKNTLRDPDGDQYLTLKDKAIKKNNADSYTVTLTMETGCPWSNTDNWGQPFEYGKTSNFPYENYKANIQSYAFSDGQSADNRWWWKTTPTGKGMGIYTMTAVSGDKELASTEMEIQQYDGANSWIQKNEFAQSLVKALTGEEVPKSDFAAKKTGLMASGYVAVDENGGFVKGDRDKAVYVEVSILGYGLTDNDAEENKGLNNYARYNAIWNIVVALDEDKVDEYLNETKPTMNEEPQKLINKYKNAAPEDVDMVNVFYQTNVHPDEITGIDHTIRFIRDLIEGGKAGKKIDYYTWDEDDMTFRYRDPAEGYEQSVEGHVVKGGYEGALFPDKNARKKAVFDTREALDSFIMVNNITTNPDGQAGMRRTNRYDYDLNRDAVFATMPETIALMRDIMKWDPLIEDEWHGYVQEMLIEPCTAPHDPAYDYDLLANNMRNLTYAAGMAVTASTGYDNFLVPWDHYDGGDWDDGGTIYSPMFAELLGCFGYTIEFPHANSDSFDAGLVIDYAQINEVLHGTTDVDGPYAGNRLNGALKDVDCNMRDAHSVDVIDGSMKKNAILSKLETKKRGIENVDSMAADKYFIDKKPVLDGNGNPVQVDTDWGTKMNLMEDVVVGRARPKDESGKTRSFFPDYIVIPTGEGQYNFAEGIKAINQMLDWGIKVDVTTEDVIYDGTTIPSGSYVLNMKQATRNVIFEVMSKGYDATGFSSMYADIYCNLPDVRGFDSIQIYGDGLFDGKTTPQADTIHKKIVLKGNAEEYVTFKSQSTDAVRAVNYLLSKDLDVWMLKRDVEGVGSASDYVMRSRDLNKIKKIKDDVTIGQYGIQLEARYIAALPEEAAKLVEPVIQWNSERTSQSGGPMWYLLDDYLGFGSLKNYNGSEELREGANVILDSNYNAYGSYGSPFSTEYVKAIKRGQAGLVILGNDRNIEKLGIEAPESTSTFVDVAVNGTYNVDDSIFSKNYARTGTYYARGYSYDKLPDKSRVLFKSLPKGEEAFIGGFQPTGGSKKIFGDKTTIFSMNLDGEGFVYPVSTVVFGQNMAYRSHYQKLLPMLATAIYAGAAGIVDDMIDPTIGDMQKNGNEFSLRVTDDEKGTGLADVSIYKDDGRKETLIVQGDEEDYEFAVGNDAQLLKVVAADKAGNVSIRVFTDKDGEITECNSVQSAIASIDSLGKQSTLAEVNAASRLYEDLTASQKEEVNAEVGDAEAIIREARKAAEAAAKAAEKAAQEKAEADALNIVADFIKALANDPTEEEVAEAELLFASLSSAEKAKVNDLVGGKGAAAVIAKAKVAVRERASATTIKKVADRIKALRGNPTAKAVEEAKIAFSSLSAADQARVDELVGGTGAAAAIARAQKIVSDKEAADARAKADKKAKDKAVAETKTKKAIADAKAKKVSNLKVTSKKRKATVSWTKARGATAYQIQYKKKSARKWKTLKKSTKKVKVTSKKLKKNKKYSFRVRPITKVNGKNVYGRWASKTIKIK